jgi:hypothetical protein
MPTRIDRVNRFLLAAIGLVLIVGGGLALSLGMSLFGSDRADQPVIPAGVTTFIRDNPWFWWAAAALCVVVALLSLRWLIAQLHTSRLSHLNVEPDRRDGETVLEARAISAAVEHEVQAMSGVSSASMRLLGQPSSHRHKLSVLLDDRADINAVRARLSRQTVANLRRALDFDDPKIDISIALPARRRRRVN